MHRFINLLERHWLLAFIIVWGIFVWLPWLAPILKHVGYDVAAARIYFWYSFTCHQLPQRSFFLFGHQLMYELPTVQDAYLQTTNFLELRQFVGNPTMGWKVAWSDRMVSFYGGIWLWAVVWNFTPTRFRPRLSFTAFLLLSLPMMIDGFSHMANDIWYDVGVGYRDTNHWLSVLTQGTLGAQFYAGNSLGTFNSWARLLTGLCFSLGLVGWSVPLLESK